MARARELREASRHVAATQQRAIDLALRLTRSTRAAAAEEAAALGRFHVALVVPMTSKGTDMSETRQSPLWFNLFASFVESIDWRANRHTFTFYLGFDKASGARARARARARPRRATRAALSSRVRVRDS